VGGAYERAEGEMRARRLGSFWRGNWFQVLEEYSLFGMGPLPHSSTKHRMKWNCSIRLLDQTLSY
jgi:hypothetical protein